MVAVPRTLVALVAVILVLGGLCAKLYLDYSALLARYDSLWEDYMKLGNEYWNLRAGFDAMARHYQSLLDNYTAVTTVYRQLRQAHSSLLAVVAELEDRLRQLQSERSALLQQYDSLQRRYSSLLANYSALDSTLRRLRSEYEALRSRYAALSKEHEELLSKYNDLLRAYSALESELQALRSQQGVPMEWALRLNNTLAILMDILYSYCCFPHAFLWALNIDEVLTVGRLIEPGVWADDLWETVRNVFLWIRNNVRYAHDVVLMVPRTPVCDPKTRLCYYTDYEPIRNYVQTPSFTIRFRQGDCEDQAILAYAMLKYYFIIRLRSDRELWIALMRMGDGGGHVAVFMPSPGGLLTIVDPAGAYLTADESGRATARPALDELLRYDDWWWRHDGIVYIELYSVDVEGRTYRLVAQGDIRTVASYISSLP